MTDRAQAYCDSLDLKYEATFVPQSQSRNRDAKHKCLNWRVQVGELFTDYMQGIGHVPGYSKWGYGRRTLDVAQREGQAAEKGLYWTRSRVRKIPAPKLVDVLYCLVTDANVLDYACFEDWADDYGYDHDSREAERIYKSMHRYRAEVAHND